METFDIVLSLCVLIFTALCWWRAKSDLTATAVLSQEALRQEAERLQVVVDNLASDLERRAERAERRLSAKIADADKRASGSGGTTDTPAAVQTPVVPDLPQAGAFSDLLSAREGVGDEPVSTTDSADTGEVDSRYVPILELMAAGITDAAEIARRTGLGRGEIELFLTLRQRKAI